MGKAVLFFAACAVVFSAAACAVRDYRNSGPSKSVDATATVRPAGWQPESDWLRPSDAAKPAPKDFVSGVSNPYWPLPVGAVWSYLAETKDGTETTRVEVLPETKQVMGVKCVVVHDVVLLDGELIEDTYDWYAQDKKGNVWYMGEDSKEYEDGKLVSSKGSWEAGVDGAEPGIKVWAKPHTGGMPYYQEFYSGQAEDLAKDISLNGTADTPYSSFKGCLVVEEWNPLEPEVVERKYYKPGIGTVKEEMVRGGEEVTLLTAYGRQ